MRLTAGVKSLGKDPDREITKRCAITICDAPLSAHTLYQLLRTISLLYGRWSTSGSDRGNAHFFTATSNTIEGTGEKRTNEQTPGVNSSAERELCNTTFPVYICRLTLAWILAKILQRY